MHKRAKEIHFDLVIVLYYRSSASCTGISSGFRGDVYKRQALEGKEAILQALDGVGAADAPPAPEESAEEQIAL